MGKRGGIPRIDSICMDNFPEEINWQQGFINPAPTDGCILYCIFIQANTLYRKLLLCVSMFVQ
jgi:hypothetical protein